MARREGVHEKSRQLVTAHPYLSAIRLKSGVDYVFVAIFTRVEWDSVNNVTAYSEFMRYSSNNL